MNIPVNKIIPNPDQPRKYFNPQALTSLTESIKKRGVISPIRVYRADDGYILEAGERRLRAAQAAGLETIPAEVLEERPDGQTSMVLAVAENMQRESLTPSEEGQAFKQLLESGWSMLAIAQEFGTCEPVVKNRLSIIMLDPQIQAWMDQDQLPSDQRVVQALINISDEAKRLGLAQKLAERKAGIKVCLSACENVARLTKKVDAPPKSKKIDDTPVQTRQKWDALAQVGQVPPWPLFAEAVKKACHRTCSMSDVASSAICQDCPMAIMVENLRAKVDGGRHG